MFSLKFMKKYKIVNVNPELLTQLAEEAIKSD